LKASVGFGEYGFGYWKSGMEMVSSTSLFYKVFFLGFPFKEVAWKVEPSRSVPSYILLNACSNVKPTVPKYIRTATIYTFTISLYGGQATTTFNPPEPQKGSRDHLTPNM
jgi:hypothetical protein